MEMQTRKVIWAVDALDPNYRQDRHTYEAIEALATDHRILIEPVYIHYLSEEFPLEKPTSQWEYKSRARARKALAHKLEKMGLLDSPHISRLTVFVQSHPTIRDATRLLADYAFDSRADMIALSTHAREGVSRLFWGSFTESLMTVSKVPVLTICPKAHIPTHQEVRHWNILFPTDFGRKSTPTFHRVLKLAMGMRARITLFHTIPVPVGPMELPIPFEPPTFATDRRKIRLLNKREFMLGQLDDERKKVARQWMNLAKSKGVEMEIEVDQSHEGVANSVLHHLEKNPAQLIAMESHESAFGAAFLGSIARSLERKAPCPVWIAHH